MDELFEGRDHALLIVAPERLEDRFALHVAAFLRVERIDRRERLPVTRSFRCPPFDRGDFERRELRDDRRVAVVERVARTLSMSVMAVSGSIGILASSRASTERAREIYAPPSSTGVDRSASAS